MICDTSVQHFSLIVILLCCCISNIVSFDFNVFNITRQSVDDILLATKVCEISTQHISSSNILYITSDKTNSGFNISKNGWNSMDAVESNLHRCMTKLPIYMRHINRYSLEEPLRQGDSLNIFVITDLQIVYSFLNSNQREKHLHKYIFIWRNATAADLQLLFEQVFKKSILHAIVLTNHTHIYTFEPFTSTGFVTQQIHASPYFYDKLKNLYGYQLNVSMFADILTAEPRANIQEGFDAVDGMVARTIMQRLNASVRYFLPSDKQNYGRCTQGKFTGVLQDLIPGKTHVAFNVRFLLDCIRSKVEGTYPFDKVTIYLVVPAAEMRPLYWIFITAFTNPLWRVLIANFVLVFVVFALMERFTKFIAVYRDTKRHNWFQIFELFYKSHLGEPVEGFAKISSLRQFLIAWIFFCYVVTNIYFAKLESNFVQPAYESELDSLGQLDRLKVPIYGNTNFFTIMQSTVDPKYWPNIEAKAVRLPLVYAGKQYAVPMIKKLKRKVAFVLRTDFAKDLIVRTYNHDQQRPGYHVVKEHLFSRPLMYITTLGSPFLYKFDQLVNAFHEFGFMQFWIDVRQSKEENFDITLMHEEGKESTVGKSHSNEEKKVILSLEILQGAFYLWFFGIAFSLVGFILEYIYWMWQKYMKQVEGRA